MVAYLLVIISWRRFQILLICFFTIFFRWRWLVEIVICIRTSVTALELFKCKSLFPIWCVFADIKMVVSSCVCEQDEKKKWLSFGTWMIVKRIRDFLTTRILIPKEFISLDEIAGLCLQCCSIRFPS